MKRLFVGNLSWGVNEDALREAFAAYGPIGDCTIAKERQEPGDSRPPRSRGFGFVEVDDAMAEKAIEEMNGKELDGRALTVNEAKPREDRPRGNFGGGNGGGYGGGNRGGWNR